jgi:hypothetical protein
VQVLIRDPQDLDVERVSVLMREIDKAECRAAGYSPWAALTEACETSVLCWTGEVDGWPHAMFGVAPVSVMGGVGAPWFLGSEQARRAARLFLREAPKYIARIEAVFPKLEGYVSTRNHSAKRWLARMGFQVENEYHVFNGEPMSHFTKGF